MFTEKTCKEFLDDLAAKKSVPGGGGAAALTGALAAALTSMVCNFTIGKKGYEENAADMDAVLEKAENMRRKLTSLVELDAKVFDELMAVYKMPKNTEEEKIKRADALEEKAKNAADVPMQIAVQSLDVQQLALSALQKGNKDLASDAILSGILGRAALKSAYYNVLINLKIINDAKYKEQTTQKLQNMLKKAEQLENEILKISEKTFAL